MWNYRRSTEQDEDDRIIKDGQVVRVPLMLADEMQRAVAGHFARPVTGHAGIIVDAFGQPAGYRPGYCFDQRQIGDGLRAAYAAYERDLLNGRGCANNAPPSRTLADAYAAYEEYLLKGRSA